MQLLVSGRLWDATNPGSEGVEAWTGLHVCQGIGGISRSWPSRRKRQRYAEPCRSVGAYEVIDAAQLCVSELVSNLINHVGSGTPVALCVSMHGTRLRVEVRDPDTRALPTLVEACTDAESGRGMALISATAERWGVQLLADCKVTWCELATGLTMPNGHRGDSHASRAEQVLDLYSEG